jgi:RNA polymerase sigma-70 factor, ECF subfamily
MSGGYMALGREAAGACDFDLVFTLHHDYVYALAHALLRNTQDAEDITQEVFLRVYKALPSYEPERASMRTWLTRMVVNACRSHRRRNFLSYLLRPTQLADEDAGPVDHSQWAAPEDHALKSEMRHAVHEVLAGLRYEHRAVVLLHYYFDLPCPEIARILGCPEGTVYSRLHYARRVVQAHLERRELLPNSEV